MNVREGRLARVRLVERLASASVAVVEAGSGYGKSTLAADVRAAFSGLTVEVVLQPDDRR